MDFDYTITSKDTFIDFIIFHHGWASFLRGLICLVPSVIAFLLQHISSSKLKELVWAYYFEGESLDVVRKSGVAYSLKKLPQLIKSNAMGIIQYHVEYCDDIYIITASSKLWIQVWSERNSIKDVFGTEFEVINDRFTGRIKNKNLQGIEKVKRIRADIDINLYDHIIAYGDSRGDYDMLNLADEAYLKFKRIK